MTGSLQIWHYLTRYIDGVLLSGILLLMLTGLFTLYSATDANPNRVTNQAVNMLVALSIMWLVANIPLQHIMRIALPIYMTGLLLLVGVALFGEINNGARRWLNIGVTRIQPSGLMKIAVPLMMAWYFDKHEATLRLRDYAIATLLLLLPVVMILRQPDLGTALLIASSGFFVLFLTGLSWRIIAGLAIAGLGSLPVLWSMMHDYQRRRVMTLLDPTQDALGAGYHTIQSTIAIGSGAPWAKAGSRNPNPSRLSPGEKHRFHICGIFGGIRAGRKFIAIALVYGGDRTRHGDCRQCLDSVHALDRRIDYAYICHVYFREHRNGHRHPACGWCSVAADQLREPLDGDNAAGDLVF